MVIPDPRDCDPFAQLTAAKTTTSCQPRFSLKSDWLKLAGKLKRKKTDLFAGLKDSARARGGDSAQDKSLRPVPNVVLLPCRTQVNLARQWHDDSTAAVSNVEPNTVEQSNRP